MNSSPPPNTAGIAGWNGAGQAVDAAGNVIPGAQQIVPQRIGVTPTFAPPPSTTGYTRPADVPDAGANPAARAPAPPAQPLGTPNSGGMAPGLPGDPATTATPAAPAGPMGTANSGGVAPGLPSQAYGPIPADSLAPKDSPQIQAMTLPQSTDPRAGVANALMRRFRGYWG